MSEPRRRVRPYPLADLPRLLHTQVDGLRILSQHLFPVLDAARATEMAATPKAPHATLDQRMAQATGGMFAVTGYETYLIPAGPAAELAARAEGAVCIALERIGQAHLRAVLMVDETLCTRLGISGGGPLAALLREVLTGAPLRVGRAIDPEKLDSELHDAPTNPNSSAGILCLDATLATAVGAGWARLLCESRLRLRVPASLPGEDTRLRQRAARLAGTAVSLVIEAGYGLLTLSAALDLSAGDILILDHFGPRPVVGGAVHLRLRNGAFPAHLDGNGLTVTGPFRSPFRASPERPRESQCTTK